MSNPQSALGTPRALKRLAAGQKHQFAVPSKKINDGEDVSFFLASTAYSDIMTFLLQLNISMFPGRTHNSGSINTWGLDSKGVQYSYTVLKLQELLTRLGDIIQEAPPDPGPRRFGNISFRKWYDIVISRISELLEIHLPPNVLHFGKSNEGGITAKDEIQAYLLGSFGSAQRLDYGTGHELSFLAFLGCIWKLGGFDETEPGVEERGIVLGIIEPYLRLIRQLILTYTLEPAGSHGVWGLDDHSFVPYIFGSAQLSPPVYDLENVPLEGSLPGAPDPADVTKPMVVERERKTNMYFSAIGFIYDVKKGPFWEHSPILFDISGVKAGWAKINKGMLKMYNAEVLSKFPVVQHFPFGSLFRWEEDPNALTVPSSVHTSSQPSRPTPTGSDSMRMLPQEGTKAPWASNANVPKPIAGTTAPWATSVSSRPAPSRVPGPQSTGTPWAASSKAPPASNATAAPWARDSGSNQSTPSHRMMPPTRAPWADGKPPPS